MPYNGHWGQSSGEGKRRITESTDPVYLARCATSTTKWMRQAAVSNAHLDPQIIHDLITHEDKYTRSAAVKNLAAEERTLRLGAVDRDEWVRKAVAEHPRVPIDLIDSLLRDSSPKVRKALANRTDLTDAAKATLAVDPDEDVRTAVIYNATITRDVVSLMAGDVSPRVRNAVSKRGADLDTDMTARLVAAAQYDVRYITRKADLPMDEATVVGLARNPDKWTRCNAVDRPDCPESALTIMAEDKEIEVRKRVARHSNATEVIKTVLGRGRATAVLLELRNRLDGREWFLSHPDPKVRANGVRVFSATGNLFGRFFDDTDETVRETAVRAAPNHPRVSRLVNDPSVKVRLAVAQALTDSDALWHMRTDPAWQVRRALALNDFTRGEVIAELAQDSITKVSHAAIDRVMNILAT